MQDDEIKPNVSLFRQSGPGPVFSERTRWAQEANPLSRLLESKRKNKEIIFDLTESNPTRCALSLNPALLRSLTDPANLTYEPNPKGLFKARQAVVDYYARKGARLHPEQIILTSGTSEAYAFLFRLLVDFEEKVLIPKPSYPLFDFLSKLNDVEIDHYSLNYTERGWRIDANDLASKLQSKPKALIVVNPNNPTGNFIHEEEKERINSLCGEEGAALISDEVFYDFAFEKDALDRASFAGNEGVLTFTLSGISKVLGLPQMKLSWIVVSGPRDLKEEALRRLEVIADTYLSVSTPPQNALEAWFQSLNEIQGRIRERLGDNRRFLLGNLQRTGIRVLESEGGWYAILQMNESLSDEEWAIQLLERQNVLVYPGYFFDFEGSYLVVSLLYAPDVFQSGVSHVIMGARKEAVH